MALLTFSQQQLIKPISANNEEDYAIIEKEVEEYEFSKLLGYALYQDIVANTANYTNLLNGCTFEDIHGRTVKQDGLLKVLAYFVYSKYIGKSEIVDTFTGFVHKSRTDSETISESTRKRLIQETYEQAMCYFELVKMYIELNSELYPLWTCVGSNKRVFANKFYGLNSRKTYEKNYSNNCDNHKCDC